MHEPAVACGADLLHTEGLSVRATHLKQLYELLVLLRECFQSWFRSECLLLVFVEGCGLLLVGCNPLLSTYPISARANPVHQEQTKRTSFLLLAFSLFWRMAVGENLFCSKAASSSFVSSFPAPLPFPVVRGAGRLDGAVLP